MIVERSGLAELSAGESDLLPENGQLPHAGSAGRLAALKAELTQLETAGCSLSKGMGKEYPSHFDLGGDVPGITMRRAALHEITAREAGDGAAALAFALALALRAGHSHGHPSGPSRMLIVMEGLSGQESGLPYGHGLAGFGLDPERLLLVSPRRAIEALWAIEEGLRSGVLAAVIGIFARLPRAYDLTASRRLVLAARGSNMPAFLAIIGEGGAGVRIASAAETRWQITARPSPRGLGGEPTAPAFTADILRRRGGEPTTYHLDWNHDTGHFSSRHIAPDAADTPLSCDHAAAPADRSGQAA